MKTNYLFLFIFLAFFSSKSLAQNYIGLGYSVGIPTADLSNHIDKISPRGVSMDYHYLIEDGLAFSVNWGMNVFYEELDDATYTEGSLSLTGKQYRYTNSFPIILGISYILFPDTRLSPYGSIGMGTVYTRRETDMGVFESLIDTWQFSIKPEAGLIYRIHDELSFKVAGKYYQNFKTPELDSQSFLTFDMGLVFYTN